MSLIRQQHFRDEEIQLQKHRKRKSHNQYFTPEIAVRKALSLVPETTAENIIDPAVGDGIFLREASIKWGKARLFGVDIDEDIVSKLNKSNLPHSYFVCGDALSQQTWQMPKIKEVLSNGGFDLVVGNPPFSSWFHRVEVKGILSNYELAHKNGRLARSQGTEILFLEMFIKLARRDGFIVIVLPDGILSNPQYQYVRGFILDRTQVLHIISLPRNVFEGTSAKASVLILRKYGEPDSKCLVKLSNLEKTGRLNDTIAVSSDNLVRRMDCFYHANLRGSSLQELAEKGIVFKPLKDYVIYCKTGKTLYGKEREFSKQGLRFLHATNITEIGINYKKDERFVEPSSKMNFPSAHAQVGDIVFVRVGVGCAGRIAVIDNEDDKGVATDYIHIFRVKDINPHFLVVYLKTKFGRWAIDLLKHGVGTVSINKTDLLSIAVAVVPKEFQEEVCERYRDILRKYRSNAQDGANRIMDEMESLTLCVEERLENGCEHVGMRVM